MKLRMHRLIASLTLSVIFAICFAAFAAAPAKLSTVASVDDLNAELDACIVDIGEAMASGQSYSDCKEMLKRASIQIALCAQALAEHELPSRRKVVGADLRDAALRVASSQSLPDAADAFASLKSVDGGEATGVAAAEYDWGKLARLGVSMSLMKYRSESLRRAMRKPGDVGIDSRHATAIALIALAVHSDERAMKNPAKKSRWEELALELQAHMTRAASAIKAKDTSATDHFRMGMETCNTCHEEFKP